MGIHKEAKGFRRKKLLEISKKMEKGTVTGLEKDILLKWGEKYGKETF